MPDTSVAGSFCRVSVETRLSSVIVVMVLLSGRMNSRRLKRAAGGTCATQSAQARERTETAAQLRRCLICESDFESSDLLCSAIQIGRLGIRRAAQIGHRPME